MQAKDRRDRKKKEDLVAYKCYEMASSAYSRVYAESRFGKHGYRDLIEPYGFSGIPEMRDYLYENFYKEIKELLSSGNVPSVDRIDTKYGYTEENIRIMEHRKNTLRGVEKRKVKVRSISESGEINEYESIEACRKAFNVKHERYVRDWLDGGNLYSVPKGYSFERIV